MFIPVKPILLYKSGVKWGKNYIGTNVFAMNNLMIFAISVETGQPVHMRKIIRVAIIMYEILNAYAIKL